MKWFSAWWGIEISAENESDELFLRELVERLPKDATCKYEEGEVEAHNAPQKEYVKHDGFTITFRR